MVAIENLQPGDMVYAMEAVGEEQSVDVDSDIETKAILQTYVHETDETYLVSIDGEDIETTAEHPFYNADGEEVAAKDLQEGDTVTTAYGDTATVDAVACIYHDEPVLAYNIAVCADHTYFVGEAKTLVHNGCGPSAKSDSREEILKREMSHDSARKALLNELDDTGAYTNGSNPYYGRLKSSYGYGKQIGRESLDGTVRWRLDFDDLNGVHYNIENFSNGKGINAMKKSYPN